MKQFFKMLFASIIGMLIVFFLGIFLMVGIFGAIVSDSSPTEIDSNSILRIAFNKPIQDREAVNPFPFLDLTSLSVNMPMGLNSILRGIEQAKSDTRIKGIYMDLSSMSAGIATVEEIRNAILDYKKSGGFVLAYANNYSQTAYYLATAADKIYLNPYGELHLKGISSEVMFYKGLLDKLGIEMQIIRHGKFKSAVEPFVLEQMSKENREQTMAFINSIWYSMLQSIGASRNIEVQDIQKTINKMELCTAQDALEKGFVDSLYYKDQVAETLCRYTESRSEKNLKLVNISDYSKVAKFKDKPSKNKIAVIYASGEIVQGSKSSNSEVISSREMTAAIRTARNDSSVKAIVFRVNSPGGDAQASEIIARELELTGKIKPVIVSMGDLAASGGYWLASAGSTILANHTTITGSIGVYGLIPNVQKGIKNMFGLTVDVASTNQYADFGNIFRPLTETERNFMQRRVEGIYTKFIEKIAKSRNMEASDVDNIGQGRVWSGNNAFDHKLIDEFGGLQNAIRLAAKRANLSDDYGIDELPTEKTPFELVFNSMGTKIQTLFRQNELENTFKSYEYIMNSINCKGIQARMPYDITVR